MAFDIRWKVLLPLLLLAVFLALAPAVSGSSGLDAPPAPGGQAAASLSDEPPLVPDSIVP